MAFIKPGYYALNQQVASYNFRRSSLAMPPQLASQALVAKDVVVDGRLALVHQTRRWLAVADLHFGYELSQRAAGRLVPMWGMRSIEDRLRELLADYRPSQLVIVGDVVHDKAAASEAVELIERLGRLTEVIVLAGNHDRQLGPRLQLRESWEANGFYFHHGHCGADVGERIQVIGHYHPAGVVRDGAGLRLKLPAFVQQGSCWILPAFSPWAAGAAWQTTAQSQMWLCTPTRILRLSEAEAAAG